MYVDLLNENYNIQPLVDDDDVIDDINDRKNGKFNNNAINNNYIVSLIDDKAINNDNILTEAHFPSCYCM